MRQVFLNARVCAKKIILTCPQRRNCLQLLCQNHHVLHHLQFHMTKGSHKEQGLFYRFKNHLESYEKCIRLLVFEIFSSKILSWVVKCFVKYYVQVEWYSLPYVVRVFEFFLRFFFKVTIGLKIESRIYSFFFHNP